MLQLINISKKYINKKGTSVQALDGINLSLGDKGLVFLLGKSGSGKSTLLNICGGLDTPDSGEIIINGKSTKDFSPAEFDSYRNTCTDFIFQEYNLLDEFSIEDNIAMALNLQGKQKDNSLIDNILEKVELKDFAKSRVNTLSGGQKQRVAIARALVKQPKCILADEPTGALDSQTGMQIFELLKKLSADTLVVVVSHDRDFAEKFGDRIIELQDGKIIDDKIIDNMSSANQNENNSQASQNFIKPKLPAKYAIKLGLGGVRKKPVKFVFTVLLTMLSLVMFGIFSSLMFFDRDAIIYQSLADTNQQVIEVRKQFERTSTKYSQEGTDSGSIIVATEMSKEDIEKLDVKNIVIPCYGSLENKEIKNLSSESLVYFSEVKGAVASDNLRYIIGNAPQNKNQVALSDYLWESLKNGELTDKSGNIIEVNDTLNNVVISFDNINYYEVCGVYDTTLDIPEEVLALKNVKEESMTKEQRDVYMLWIKDVNVQHSFYNYIAIHESAYEDFISQADQKKRFNCDSGFIYSIKYSGNEFLSDNNISHLDMYSNYYDVFGTSSTYKSESNAVVLYYEDYANVLDKYLNVVSNQSMSDEFYANLESQNIRTLLKDVIDKKGTEDTIIQSLKTVAQFLSEYAAFDFNLDIEMGWYSQSIKLLGFTMQNYYMLMSPDLVETYKEQCIMQNKSYSEFRSEYDPQNYDDYIYDSAIVLTDNYSRQDYADLLASSTGNGNTNFVYYNSMYQYFSTVTGIISFASDIFLYLGIAFMVFSMLLLFNFISGSIFSKRRQMGILWALGSGKKELFKIYTIEPLMIIIISCILALILTSLCVTALNVELLDIDGINLSLFVFDWKAILSVIGVALVSGSIATIIPIIKAIKKTPVECIRTA